MVTENKSHIQLPTSESSNSPVLGTNQLKDFTISKILNMVSLAGTPYIDGSIQWTDTREDKYQCMDYSALLAHKDIMQMKCTKTVLMNLTNAG